MQVFICLFPAQPIWFSCRDEAFRRTNISSNKQTNKKKENLFLMLKSVLNALSSPKVTNGQEKTDQKPLSEMSSQFWNLPEGRKKRSGIS